MKKRMLIYMISFISLCLVSLLLFLQHTPSSEHVKIGEAYQVTEVAIYTVMPEDHIQEIISPPFVGKSIDGFKEALGFKESRGNYFAVNRWGYLGKYQFGVSTLKTIGVYNPSFFLRNPEIQEKALIANLERNKWILRKYIKRFDGKVINGINITESGILAAAHLAGPGNVKKYLRSLGNRIVRDANGTSIQYYMKKFSGYDLSRIVPKKAVKI